MRDTSAGPVGADPTGRGRHWRLIGVPAPTLPERLSRAVGLRVIRVPGGRRVFVVAGSVDRLRDLLADPASLAPTRGTTVLVVWWRASRKGWSGRVGPLEHMRRHRVALPRWGRGLATVRIRLGTPVPFRTVLGAALHALEPARPLPAPASADVTGHGLLPAYLPASASAVPDPGPLPARAEIRAHDLVLGTADGPAYADGPADGNGLADGDGPPYGAAYTATGHGLRPPSGEPLVLVNAERINPRGRRAGAYLPDAPRVDLDLHAAGRRSGRSAPASAARPLDGSGLDAATLATLRQVGVVRVPRIDADVPVPTAALLVQVAMTGAVVAVPPLPPPVADLLDPELRAILAAPLVESDPLALEARSVRQRRAAMRGHAPAFALPRLAATTFPELRRPPSVSAILATRRSEMLTDVLRAIAGQTYPELEIVLCLHGIELPAEARTLLEAAGRPFQVVRVPAGISFGEALGEATRRAHGTLVTKFDDDDTYSVEHVWDLVLARHYSGATLVGKMAEFVHLETSGITIRRTSGVPESAGEMVAGGTMLLAKGDLESVGGWRPVPRSVDLGLIERLRRDGALIYRTHALGYVYHRRATGHTWDPGEKYFLDTAFARWTGIPQLALGVAGPAPDLPPTSAPTPDQPPGNPFPLYEGSDAR